ncbi:MAG: carboxypeptidase-like regulatory domain-containing protein [Acidobacteriota bacterium]
MSVVLGLALVACGVSWARVEGPGTLHLWRLHGVFVDAAGKPIANTEVTLMRDGKIAYRTSTDKAGRFAFPHAYGHYLLQIDRSRYSLVSRPVVIGVDMAMLHRTHLYVIAGPGACTDDCSDVFTSKNEFEKAIRRNTEHHY